MPKLKPPCRTAVAHRLKRAAGHLNATLAMIEAAQPSLVLARQLAAVEAAVRVARHEVVHDQMRVCLEGGVPGNDALHQLKALTRSL
jgi:DNA-binding FrmR family transcriptional regulator